MVAESEQPTTLLLTPDSKSAQQCFTGLLQFTAATKRRPEDPMSHRIIEKRRRDRMNNCLADLSRLIPAEYLKKGRGRIEKTEIIEMAIKYMKYLQSRLYNNIDKCDLRNKTINAHDYSSENGQQCSNENTFQSNDLIFKKGYQLGFQECLSEVMHYLVEAEGYYPEEKMCVRLMNHLENQCDRILKGDRLVNQNRVDTLTPPTNCDPKITVDNNIYATHSDGEIAYGEINRPVRKGIIIPAPSMRKSNASSCDDIANLNIRSSIVGSDGSERIQISQNQIENNGGGQDNIGTESNSQLREILTGPAHINNVFASQARPNIIRKLPVESKSVVHHNVIMNNEQNATAGNSLYKFKNNIKERFSAEHSSNGVVISGAEMCAIKKKRRLSTDDSSVNSDQTLNDTPPPPSVKQMRESSPSIPSHPVPIFALHAKGAFYVPLTIDSELLGPFLTDLSTDLNVNTFSSLVLHPVTISVNFQRQVMQPIKPFESVLSSPEWPEPRGKIMSMSKWSSCINI